MAETSNINNIKILTGNNYIDSLLLGFTWSGNVGRSSKIYYTYDQNSVDESFANSLKTAVRAWASVANVDFKFAPTGITSTQVTDINIFSDVTIFGTGLLGEALLDLLTSQQINSSEIKIASQLNYTPGHASGGYLVMLHEIGHVLGLKHAGEYGGGAEIGPFLPTAIDSQDATIMSYIPGLISGIGNQAQTPMMLDILALQYLYGANMSHNAGNDVHSFNGNSYVGTIWDAGGIDTIDGSASSVDNKIDLREGLSNFSKIGQAFVWNAFGSNIEGATTGAGQDIIYGNQTNNIINSNGGNDSVYAAQGNDIVITGDGNDIVFGGKGNDTIRGGPGNDILNGDLGDDSLFGGKSDDILTGGNGNDTLSGDMGNDQLNGGDGSDFYVFNNMPETEIIYSFQPGIDKILISKTLFSNSQQALDSTSASGSNSVISFGSFASTVTISGVDKNLLTLSDFVIL